MDEEIKVDCRSTNVEKIRLFRSLFYGRQDVFARRFENAKKGTSGYLPCCQNQWGPACALKQYRKCGDCAARNVREVLTGILTRVLEQHPEVGLDSYDRIVPCQDTLPKGGFGNLIALPLQAEPRKIDSSVFVNDDWMPHPDPWAFLSSVKRMTPLDLEAVRRKLGCNGRALRANVSATPADGARRGSSSCRCGRPARRRRRCRPMQRPKRMCTSSCHGG